MSKHMKLNIISYVMILSFAFIMGVVFVSSLVAPTFAYFSTNMNVNNQVIVAANFDLDSNVYSVTNATNIELTDGKYHLEAGTYTITFKRSGSSKDSIGYGLIEIGSEKYYSNPLESNKSIEFTLNINAPMDITFKPLWGSVPTEGVNMINDKDTISLLVEIPEPVADPPAENPTTEENNTEPMTEETKDTPTAPIEETEPIVQNDNIASQENNSIIVQ